ncbi:DNA cytosine methyltransferase [Neisseria perflava]|uniref:DNA cytosine methyltransferase n=1 Tax=Neisseria perflava TaxID=33053 RepID=UPI0020A04850|nr:DNA (cytosine-5-)-methyltransferase [Neisseria perflava]MCP1661151.1 DNA (cytosine-5)-methyltransferase 1 [Neisseria perflava]
MIEKKTKSKNLSYIDLFSGAGGFTLGFEQQGFRQLFSVEIEPNYAQTYAKNFPTHKLLCQDIKQLNEKSIQEILGGEIPDVVIGGPPCQGFSIAGNIGRTFANDERNRLFTEFVRIVQLVKPRFFVMENVARLYTHNKGKTRQEILECFENIGYRVECQILDAADFGVPQHRKRIIFIGTRENCHIYFPIPSKKHKTVEEAIGYLPPLNSGESSEIANHVAMTHSEQMLYKMKFVRDGGNRNDIPENIRPKTGDVRKYIRYNSKKPSVCITGDMRKVFHYKQNRALTVRELAALQSFPDSFVFYGNKIAQQQQVGNAVPPQFAAAIAQALSKMDEESCYA